METKKMSGANPKIRATPTKVERTIVIFFNNFQNWFFRKKGLYGCCFYYKSVV
ncbi:MAG: hypothetical protein RL757_549 [Bacteroidota bacterium]|jgi:hypothetical protein